MALDEQTCGRWIPPLGGFYEGKSAFFISAYHCVDKRCMRECVRVKERDGISTISHISFLSTLL